MATARKKKNEQQDDGPRPVGAVKPMPGTREITIPESIVVGPNKEVFHIGSLVRWFIDNHPVYVSSGKGMRAGVRAEQAFCLGEPQAEWPKAGDVVRMLEDDWKMLHDALENPPPAVCMRCGSALGFGGYPVNPPGKLLPYLDAVGEAVKR